MWSQVRGFGYKVSFKGNENNSIIQPQLKPNGVNGSIAKIFVICLKDFFEDLNLRLISKTNQMEDFFSCVLLEINHSLVFGVLVRRA